MTYPTVPARSRKSGELTFVRFVAVDDADHGSAISVATDSAGKIEFTIPNGDEANFAVDDRILIVGTDDDSFNGYHVVSAVSAGSITVNTAWPSAATSPVAMEDTAKMFSMSDFATTGQATDTSGGSSSQSDTWSTIGVEDEDIAGSMTYDVSMTLYVDDDLAVSKLLGYPQAQDPAVIKIDSDAAYHVHVLLETYSSRNKSTSVLLHSTLYEFVKWDSWNTPQGAGAQNFGQWELSGSTKHKYVLKPRS